MSTYKENYYYLKYDEKEKEANKKGLLEGIKKFKPPRETTWFFKSTVCKDCDSNIVVCQAHPPNDYWYYCSNKMCKNHHLGEELGDQEICSFSKGSNPLH